ncbi:MAG: methyltransferase [Syntrophobacteraceae bacterium]
MESVDGFVGINLRRIFARLYRVLASKRGEVAAVIVFGFFMVQDFRALFHYTQTMVLANFLSVVVFLNGLLLTGYYALLVWIYVTRSAASLTTKSLPAKIIALAATFMPFTFPMLNGPARPGIVILMVSSLILLFGMVFTMAALTTLGKSFSLIPQTRRLVTGGPYRLVRHPVYVGELIAGLGLVVWAPSIAKTLVFLLLVGCEVYRALQEEKLLAEAFADYPEYVSKTARFIPGLL